MDPAQWELLDAVDRICRDFRTASVTSWWRTAKRNASLPGSVPNSQHVHGLAIDLVFDGTQPTKAQLEPYMGPSMQIDTSEPGHIHIEQDPRLLAGAGTLAFAISPSFASLAGPTPSATPSPLSESATAPSADAPSERSPLDKLGPKGKRRG